jgi:outer membrane lipoprotein-sorting protein
MKAKMIIFVIFCVVFVGIAHAESNKGLEIAKQADAVDRGWVDEQVQSVMTLKAADGREVKRILRTRSLEMENDGDRSLVIFDLPGDVKGTVFLTYSHKTGDDDQWLYLPALKRVKRISSSNRSGPFMGSEFAFEDVSSEEIERYSYSYVGEEICAGTLECYVYERIPVEQNSGYSKQIVYADKDKFRIHRIEYFDRKGEHQKTLLRKNYKQYGNFWRADRWEMVNHQKNKSTFIDWSDRKFGSGLTLDDFNQNSIRRFR